MLYHISAYSGISQSRFLKNENAEFNGDLMKSIICVRMVLFVCFVALRSMSTAKVMAGRSINLAGQASTRG